MLKERTDIRQRVRGEVCGGGGVGRTREVSKRDYGSDTILN